MNNQNRPATVAELMAHLRAFAKLGVSTLETAIRDYNLRIPEIASRAKNRAESREAYATMHGDRDFQNWLAQKREAFIAARGEEFDRERPAIHVPERVELSVAKEIVEEHAKANTTKGRAA